MVCDVAEGSDTHSTLWCLFMAASLLKLRIVEFTGWSDGISFYFSLDFGGGGGASVDEVSFSWFINIKVEETMSVLVCDSEMVELLCGVRLLACCI